MMTAQAKGDKEVEILSLTGANRALRLRISRRAKPPLADTAALIVPGCELAPEKKEMETLSLPGWAAPTWAGTVTPP